MSHWQPTAPLHILQQRAQILANIRTFFQKRQVLEVETPTLSHTSNPDPNLHSFQAPPFYLQTSPEFHMKRLLAAGSGCIYQISKAFRVDEVGSQHNPEFTLLEWYRIGFDHHQLMDEVDELLQQLLNTPSAQRLSYATAFEEYLQINPHTASLASLQTCAQHNNIVLPIGADARQRDTWLQLLMHHCIEPRLGINQPSFIYDYPASQASLARVSKTDPPVAQRFEVYIAGIELANGFHELTDPIEQQQRLQTDNHTRTHLGLPTIPIDNYFLAALKAGLPTCAGIALGIDRLVMLATNSNNIQSVLSFPIEIA